MYTQVRCVHTNTQFDDATERRSSVYAHNRQESGKIATGVLILL